MSRREAGRSPRPDDDSFAVERTMLAWNRTGLALLVGGVFVLRFLSRSGLPALRPVLGALLVATGALCQALAWGRGRTLGAGTMAPLAPAVARALSMGVAGAGAVAVLSILTRT